LRALDHPGGIVAVDGPTPKKTERRARGFDVTGMDVALAVLLSVGLVAGGLIGLDAFMTRHR
jgi:hypothetical protein